MMPRFWIPLAAGALALAALASSAPAQCPDNLDGGPCHTRAFETLPAFPKVVQQVLEICWKDCGIDQQQFFSATWNPTNFVVAQPGAVHCGVRTSTLIIRNSGNQIAWAGNMRLQYSRTWMQVTQTGIVAQVWRFLVNGDLIPFGGAGASPCPKPPCAQNFNRVRFTGYIDYSLDCATNVFYGAAWMLTHACDGIDHAAGFPRSGVFHPDRAYTFVGPGAGFIANALVPTENGPATAEAIRRSQFPPTGSNQPIDCEYEDPLLFGVVSLNQTYCLCGQTSGPQQYADSTLNVASGCGSSVNPQGTPPIPGFLSMGLGSWTNPIVFPGTEDLRWNCGNYSYFDSCTGVTRNEFFFGVTTIIPDPTFQLTSGGFGPLLDKVFVDQSNSLKLNNSAMQRNVQYVSDHFLNLNIP